jgi:hypothetical protein
MPNSTSINFILDYYSPIKPRDNIFLLAYKNCDCREIILSIDINNLIIGQSYTVEYSTVNDTSSFSPSTQIVKASANYQKISTIMYIDPSKIHIVKVEVSGVNITASQMCVIKCGTLNSCEVNEKLDIVLNEYNDWEYKIDQFPIIKFVPYDSSYNDVIISIDNLEEISSTIALLEAVSPLINVSSDIKISGTKIGTLICLSNFVNQGISVTSGGIKRDSIISQGVLNLT